MSTLGMTRHAARAFGGFARLGFGLVLCVPMRLAIAVVASAAIFPQAVAGVSITKPKAVTVFDVSVDWQTGYAISGFDPVAYYIQGRAIQGSRDHEAMWKGVVWSFRSAGNRDAFLAHPNLYAPVFGGHDPQMAEEGFVAEGNPTLWAIREGKLLFFHSEETRRAYDAEAKTDQAARR